MWGNKDIKDNKLWGIATIYFTELKVNNIVYCAYVTDKLYSLEFEYTKNITVGNYLLYTLPNYVQNGTILQIVPENILINAPKFNDLNLETLKSVIFGDINIANAAINIFGEDILRGEIKIAKNYNTQNSSFETALVNFWNSTDLDIPFIWSVIADWVCKNNYELKKQLCNKCLTHKFTDMPKPTHNSDPNIKIRYWYANNVNEFICSESKPNNHKYSLEFLKSIPLKYVIEDEYQKRLKFNDKSYDIQVSIWDNGYKYASLVFYKKNHFEIKIYIDSFYSKHTPWYFTTSSDNIFILEPIKSLHIDLYPISGFTKNNFKIECPECIIETDLDILACRSEYFNTSNLKADITSEWDLRNLVNFIMDCECEIKDWYLELEIANYYKCKYYKIYIDNWLKVNDLYSYYKYYKLI